MTLPYAPTMKVAEGQPDPANVRAGYVTAAGTLLTVPAGRIWRGSLQLSASLVTAAGAAAATFIGTMTVAGAGAAPAAGSTLLGLRLTTPAVGATNTIGAADSGTVTVPDVVLAAGSADLTLAVVASGTVNGLSAAAIGVLL